jgi:hypothetical protein
MGDELCWEDTVALLFQASSAGLGSAWQDVWALWVALWQPHLCLYRPPWFDFMLATWFDASLDVCLRSLLALALALGLYEQLSLAFHIEEHFCPLVYAWHNLVLVWLLC